MRCERSNERNRDNDLIYLASPTPPSSLPPIVPFPLAKPTPPRELLEPLNHLSSQQGGAWLQAMLPSRVRDALEVWDDRKRVWFADEVQKVVRGLDDQATRYVVPSAFYLSFFLPFSRSLRPPPARFSVLTRGGGVLTMLMIPAAAPARNSSLATMNLPAALESTRHQQQQQQQPAAAGSVVPPHLLEHSQRIQGQGGLAKLETMMKDVRRISSVNRKLVQEVSWAREQTFLSFLLGLSLPLSSSLLLRRGEPSSARQRVGADVTMSPSLERKQSRDLLDREAEIDSSYRQMYGPSRWSRPTSAEAAAPLFQRVEQFEAVLAAASQSDGLVRAKYGEWESALALLERGQVRRHQSVSAADCASSQVDPDVESHIAPNLNRVPCERRSRAQPPPPAAARIDHLLLPSNRRKRLVSSVPRSRISRPCERTATGSCTPRRLVWNRRRYAAGSRRS